MPANLVKLIRVLREPEGSLPCSRPANGLGLESQETSSHPRVTFLDHFNIILPFTLRPPKVVSPLQIFKPQFRSYEFLSSPLSTFSSHSP